MNNRLRKLRSLSLDLSASSFEATRAGGGAVSADFEELLTVEELSEQLDTEALLPQPGSWIGGTYRVVDLLGTGAMGVVVSAEDTVLERRVAVKLIRSAMQSSDFRRRFMEEARAMALVSHPNVVAIHALGEHEKSPFIVMELVEGVPLDVWMHEQVGPPDIDVALRIMNQVCLGVSAIHAAGTVHRDLKPGNVLLDRELRARVSDLGLAVRLRDGTVVREVVGSPGYIAPEILFGIGSDGASPRADVYSLACIAYELFTGRPVFSAESHGRLAAYHVFDAVPPPSSVRPELPNAFDEVLLHALKKDPKERTPSADLFRRALIEARNDCLEPVRILVAEDNDEFRELVAEILSREFPDADIECVADGKEAVAAFDRLPASVVLLDLQLPELDGIQVTAALRARMGSESVPIIVLTAAGGPIEWQRLAGLGADRFLVKPVHLDDLLATIRRAVRERSSRPPPSARH